MEDLIALTRTMNLYYHHLHNIAHGISFRGDHEMMAEFYEALDAAYDSLIERRIGLGGSMSKPDILAVVADSLSVLKEIPEGDDMGTHFHHAMYLEASLQRELESVCKGASRGTCNLLEQLMDDSEARVYKLGQRAK